MATKGVDLLGVFGDDRMVVNAARVSFAKWKDVFDEADARLIRYLAAHNHWSPFAHPQAQFRISMPIFVARQWFKHQVGFARNEVSRRYVDDPPTVWEPTVWRRRAPGAKQGSSDQPIDNRAAATMIYRRVVDKALLAYGELLEHGVAPEQARAVLPQAAETQFIETASLYAYARLCRLRLAPDAQAETRCYAQAVADHLARAFPVSWAALMEPDE